MNTLTRALIGRVPASDEAPEERSAGLSLLEGYTSAAVNTVLFVIKLALGLLSHSVALVADAVHTLADSATSIVVIVGAYVGRRPADRDHPFGHGRAELVGAVIIAVLLGVAALEFGKVSVVRLLDPRPLIAPWWVVAVVAATALVKEWLARFAAHVAALAESQALAADAWHHRSDVLATLLVVVAMVASRFGVLWLDGVMGLGVSVVLLWTTIRVAKDAITPLLGAAPSPAEIDEIAARARTEPGVLGVHDIVVHYYGTARVVSLHVEVTDELSSVEAHELAERVEARVGGRQRGMVVAHVDPVNHHHPHYQSVHQLIAELIEDDPRLEAFHDLRLVGDEDAFDVVFDVSVRETLARHARGRIRERARARINARFPEARVSINFEPVFAYDGQAGAFDQATSDE